MLYQPDGDGAITTNRDQKGYWDAYIWVNDVDALFTEMSAKEAVIDYEPIVQQEYNNKEFAIRDPDGHVIAFGQTL